MNKVERVAVALFMVDAGGEGWPDGMPESAKEHYRKQARAAIEASQEPGPTKVLIGQLLRAQNGHLLTVRTVNPDGSFAAITRWPLSIEYDRDGKQTERKWPLDIDWFARVP